MQPGFRQSDAEEILARYNTPTDDHMYVDDAHRIGSRDGKFDPVKCEVFGERVAIRKDEMSEEVNMEGIVIPTKTIAGFKGSTGTVISIGKDAVKRTGLKINDRVKFDDCSPFYDTYPVIITNSENVIVKVSEEEEHIPLKEDAFVLEHKALSELEKSFQQSSIILPNSNADAKIGKVIKADKDSTVKVGDKILMTKDETVAEIKSKKGKYFIYKPNSLIAVIEE
jgi:co-chaperonin GroES (HSP10)|tara:strand:+ start:291 stop:965 length:675 start_codon:yes stop_codon:yes gene_type:complete